MSCPDSPHRVRVAWLVVVMVFTGACRFDKAVPAGAEISCTDASQCPQGFTCLVSSGRCLPTDAADREAPQVLSSTFERTLLARGDVLRVTFVSSEPLAIDPTAVASEEGRVVPLALVASLDGDHPSYTFELSLGADDLEGSATIVADLLDRSGNENRNAVLGSVTLDFTPPQVSALNYIAPRGTDGGVVPVRSSETVQVRVLVSEAVQSAPLHLIARSLGCDAGVVDYELLNNSAGLLDFRRVSPAGTGGCDYGFVLAGARDLAGNATTEAAVSLTPTYRIDDAPPEVTGLALFLVTDAGWTPSSVFSRQPGFETLGLRFSVDTSVEELRVSLDQSPLGGCDLGACTPGFSGLLDCQCARAVNAGDVEGTHVVLVTAQDGAANSQSASAALRFDFTGPQVIAGATNLSLVAPAGSPLSTVTALGQGGTARLGFTLDEAVGADPVVSATAPESLLFTRVGGAFTTFLYSLVLAPGAHAQGPASVQVSAVDAVGNQATSTLLMAPVSFVVDSLAPAAPDTLSDAGILYSRTPWGSDATAGQREFHLEGAPGSAEAGAVVIALDGPAAGASELGRTLAATDGSFRITLQVADRAAVFVKAVDSGGNSSPVADVKNVAWVATLIGKVPNSSLENPHDLELRPIFNPAFDALDAVAAPNVARLASADGVSVTNVGGGDWLFRPVTTTVMNGLIGASMAYDEARSEMVLFGGEVANLYYPDTYLRVGLAWIKVTPADPEGDGNPGTRLAASMTYDSSRGVMVMFGGEQTSSLNDLWEWNGRSWKWVTPLDPEGDGSPAPGYGWASVYDPVRRVVVMYDAAAIWEWNGSSWRKVIPTDPEGDGNPAAVHSSVAAFDPVRGVMLYGYGTGLGQLWAWNGTSWAKLVPTDPEGDGDPTQLGSGSMAWDRERSKAVLQTSTGLTWEWNGASWARVLPGDPEADGNPAASALLQVAFDVARKVTVKFGGNAADGALTWEWNGASWANRTSADPEGDGNPGPLYAHASAFEGTPRNLTRLVGGQPTNFPYSGFSSGWAWNGISWARENSMTSSPPVIVDYPAYVFRGSGYPGDSFAFGGSVPNISASNVTQRWAGSYPLGWLQLSYVDPEGDGNPSPRFGSAMYAKPSGNVFMYGGTDGNVPLGELWELTLTYGWSWVLRAPLDPEGDGNPPPMAHAAMAFDTVRNLAVLFGSSGEVWEWNNVSWAKVIPTDPEGDGNPAPSAYTRMAWNSDRRRVDLLTTEGELWEWNGASWLRWPIADPQGDSQPGRRSATTLAYDSSRKRLVSYGGVESTGVSSATWEWDPSPTARQGQVLKFDFSAAGAEPGSVVSNAEARVVAGATSEVAGVPSSGVQVSYWVNSHFDGPTVNVAGPAAPAQVTTSLSDSAKLASLFVGARKQVAVAVTPIGVTGNGPGALSVDYAELTISYRRP